MGLELSSGGIVEADERLATSVEGIWAAGDIRGGPMFTYTFWDDYRVLLSQMAGDGSHTTTTRRVVPYAIFTDPELGRVGMTEREAARDVEVMRFEMSKDGEAQEIGETGGLLSRRRRVRGPKLRGAAAGDAEGSLRLIARMGG